MNAAFIFDTILFYDNENYYGMTLTYDFFKEKYLDKFKSIQIYTRCVKKSEMKGNISGYKKTNGKNVIVNPSKFYHDIPDAIKNKRKIKEEINEIIKKCDFVIIRMPSVLGIIACQLCKKNKKEYLVEMVACAWDGYMNHARFGGKILAPIMYLKTKKSVKYAPYVIYVTKEFLQKRYPNNNHNIACSDVVLNENDNTIYKNRTSKIKSFKTIEDLKLCTVANVGLKYKGQKYVLEAISNLKKENIKMNYYLIGNGDNSNLKRIAAELNISDQIHFVGSLPHDEVFKELEKMDIYIQPSLQEGLPRALVEAMSLGLPCIGSNAGGIPELLNKKCIFAKKDSKGLTNILKKIDKDFLLKSSEENYEKSQSYTYSHLNNKRNNFYKKIL